MAAYSYYSVHIFQSFNIFGIYIYLDQQCLKLITGKNNKNKTIYNCRKQYISIQGKNKPK